MEVRIGNLVFVFDSTKRGPSAEIKVCRVTLLGENIEREVEVIEKVTAADIRCLARALGV